MTFYADVFATLGDDTTVQNCVATFRRGEESFEDDPTSGHRSTATTEENIHRVQHMVMDNERLTIKQTDY